jgi:uroporphyrin-III C-methyltransferase
MSSKPTVSLVGSGPGSVDLLTVKALRLLQSAQWILHDALVSQEILALAPQATLIDVGKRAGSTRHAARQADINKLLVETAKLAQQSGGSVVRLKGGDPLIFARAEEEMHALQEAGISFEVVPGITAAQAAHAQIRQPLTKRGTRRSFVLTTPQVQTGDSVGTEWARPLVAARAGAIYMAASATSRIKGTLIALGLGAQTPVCWVLNAGLEDSQVIEQTLGSLSFPTKQSAPALLLIGTTPWTSYISPTGSTSATSLVSLPPAHLSASLSV